MKTIAVCACLILVATLVASKPARGGFRSDDSCKSYEMKCVFIQGTHNGTTIHNRGAILDDCSCGFETGRLQCSNELLKPEAANCNCKCN